MLKLSNLCIQTLCLFLVNSTVLILTEAGKNIGFGHYTRCTALQQALQEYGRDTDMFIYLNEMVVQSPGQTEINWIEQLDFVLEQTQYHSVVIDSYLADEQVYRKLNQCFPKVIALDDYNRIVYPVKYVVNPNVFFSDMDYTNQSATCYGGKDFVILRKPFRNSEERLPISKSVSQILITIGGSDFRNILPDIIRACASTDVPRIIVIAPEGIDITERNSRIQVLSAQDADNMYQLMRQSDVVISACGQTLHELASLSKPTIGICLDVDQVPNQKYYLATGFLALELLWNDSDLVNKILIGLKDLESSAARGLIEKLGPSLINTNGVMNVVSLINEN